MAQSSAGNFLPSTQVWDVSELRDMDVTKPAFKELLIRMYQNFNQMAISLNNKESSFYDTQETIKGQAFFASTNTSSANTPRPESRQVFNKVINFGALPNTATKTYAHGITINAGCTFTRIYGCSTKQIPFEAIPLPYSSPVPADNIALYVDATTVGITTGANWPGYDTTYIVLEYLKA